LFLGQLVFAVKISKDFEKKWMFFLSPSFLLVFYVNLNIFMGAYSLNNNLLLEVYQYRSTSYKLLKDINIPYAYIALCSFISMLILPSQSIQPIEPKKQTSFNFKKISFCFLLILLFSILKVDLAIIGGNGDFSTIPKSIASIIIFYELAKHKVKLRFLIYVIILLLFVATNYESKREAVFMIIPIILFENVFENYKTFNFSLKKILVSLLSIIILIYSLLIMTILRGFGGYDISNPLLAYKYVDDLLKDFNVGSLLFTVSEAPTTTYVSIKAMSLAQHDSSLISYGASYFKLLFVPIPRSLFDEKPLNMTSVFTKIEDPGFYGIGGSLPINVYAESFWNFHFAGIIVIGFILLVLNFLFRRMYESIIQNKFSPIMPGLVFAFTYILGFYRGFGFDLFTVNVIVGIFFSIFMYTILHVFLNENPIFEKKK
tara:strand:- start:15025 stop:16314 length:1290 start_codon:yes stop_codon:yes gene_type:complete